MTNGHDRDSGGDRVCNIQGNRASIAAARREIERIIAENEKATSGSAASSSGGASRQKYGAPTVSGSSNAPVGSSANRDSSKTRENTQIFVPDRTVGLIIGRGGETIRDIQDKSGCHVNIVGEAKSQNGQRPVNLIGTPAASEHARRLIMEIVESDTNGGPPGGGGGPPARGPPPERGAGGGGYYGGDAAQGGQGQRITDVMRVPIEAVGMIIGKGTSPSSPRQGGIHSSPPLPSYH